jgi:hypothetical protein
LNKLLNPTTPLLVNRIFFPINTNVQDLPKVD